MKKLLFAIAGAASFAALAADPTPGANDISIVGFENYTADKTVVGYGDSGTQGDNSLWTCAGEDASLVKTYGGDNAAAPSIAVPAPFADGGEKYLALDTNGSELQRAIPSAGQAVAADGTYIDTLVQFTPSESAPTSTDLDGAKLAIWLGVDSENNTTNLYVQGAYYDTLDNGYTLDASTTKAYKLNKSCEPNTWYRLTVKAVATLGNSVATGQGEKYPGFVIMIDGEEVATSMSVYSSDALTLYFAPTAEGAGGAEDYLDAASLALLKAGKFIPSLDSTRVAATLTSVGFKGTGAIDDFVVTTAAPEFAPAVIDFTLTLTKDENVSSVAITVDGTDVVFTDGAAQIPSNTVVTIAAPAFAEGYELDAFSVGGQAIASPTFPYTFTMEAATAVAITSKAVVAYPTYVGEDATLKAQYDTWKAANGADSASAYEKQFLLNVASGTTVADNALQIDSITENETAGWDIVVSTTVTGAALSDGTATTYNGYLVVVAADTLAGLSSATPVAYPVTAVDGGKVKVTVTSGQFMKVQLTTTAPAAPAAQE